MANELAARKGGAVVGRRAVLRETSARLLGGRRRHRRLRKRCVGGAAAQCALRVGDGTGRRLDRTAQRGIARWAGGRRRDQHLPIVVPGCDLARYRRTAAGRGGSRIVGSLYRFLRHEHRRASARLLVHARGSCRGVHGKERRRMDGTGLDLHHPGGLGETLA